MRSPLKWHGGKHYLASRIIELMPKHEIYVEPFLGGGSVLLNKPSCEIEIAADIDNDLICMWKTLQGSGDAVRWLLADMRYSQADFDDAYDYNQACSLERQAAKYIARNRMSRGGLGSTFAWSERQRGGMPGDKHGWLTMIDSLPDVIERIELVKFREDNAINLIPSIDERRAFFYCDPPYLQSTRTVPNAYKYEATVGKSTEQDHKWHSCFLEVVKDCVGKVMISGYPSKLYQSTLKHWRYIEFDMPNHSGQGSTKQRRTECLWLNY